MKAHVTDYSLYRWRYGIGYLVIALVVIGVLGVAAWYVPGALRQGELDSALVSGSLSGTSLSAPMVIDLPYHLLQRLSFMALGVTTFSIKLPSIILGIGTTIGIYFLVQSWFRRNVAVLVTVLATTSTQFLFLIQDGTPSIMHSFTIIWLLVAVTHITRGKLFSTFWKVVACVLMAVSLYNPLGIYPVLAIAITASFHPHIRYVLRRISRARLIIAGVLGLVSIAPLIYATIIDPQVGMKLVGAPSGHIDLLANLKTVGKDLFGFFAASDSHFLRPFYSLGIFLLMAIGLFKLITVKYTARSYTVLILGAFMIPLVILDPTQTSNLYPLAVLMIAMGIATLIVNWYKLFPLNPYARVAGLLPLSVLVCGLVFSGVMRYMNNYTYNPEVLAYFDNDLRLIDREVKRAATPEAPVRLVTTSHREAFYQLVAHYDKRLSVSTNYENAPPVVLVTREAYHTNAPDESLTLSRIITSRKANQSDRLYLYTKSAQ